MRRRRPPSLGCHVRRATTQTFALTAVAGLVVVGGAGMARVGDQPSVPEPGTTLTVLPQQDRTTRLMDRFDCSTVGYGDGRTPQAAIVRGASGRVRVVTFDEGWRVHTTPTRSELVAVCLRPPP